MKTKVFVYGTLLRGEPNNRLLAESEFVTDARTQPEYTMVDCGYYPAVLEGGETAVAGEVYEVDARTLKRLDLLEGVPRLYIRKTIKLDDGTEAEVYIMNSERGSSSNAKGIHMWITRGLKRVETDLMSVIEDGDWINYLVEKYEAEAAL